jgi:hypothetical protein
MKVLSWQGCLKSESLERSRVFQLLIITDHPVVVVVRHTEVEKVGLESVDVEEEQTVICVLCVVDLLSVVDAIYSRSPKGVVVVPWSCVAVNAPRISDPHELIYRFATGIRQIKNTENCISMGHRQTIGKGHGVISSAWGPASNQEFLLKSCLQ